MKRFLVAIAAALSMLAAAALAEDIIQVPVGASREIEGWSGAEESVWYSEDDAVATVSGGMSGCTVTGVSIGSVRIVHRYVYSEPFSEFDSELGKTVTGTRSVTQRDYYSVEVVEGAADAPVDAVTSPSVQAPSPTARPRANGEYAYKIYVTAEAKAEMKNYGTLKPGDKGKKVKQMKERLVELGYLLCLDKVNNKYDDETRQAVYEFQIANNLTGSDGVAYAYTQYKLFDEYAIPAWGRYYYTLYCGDSGWDITNLQKRLCDTGYLADEFVNGEFGQETLNAVMCFQEENGLEPDGVAYDWLQEILFSSQMNSYGVE